MLIKYGRVIYCWKAHGEEISISSKKNLVLRPKVPRSKNEQNWVFNKYGPIHRVLEAHGKISKITIVAICTNNTSRLTLSLVYWAHYHVHPAQHYQQNQRNLMPHFIKSNVSQKVLFHFSRNEIPPLNRRPHF